MFYYHDGGFYIPSVHIIPEGAVPVAAEEHEILLAGQAAGKTIVTGDNGRPILQDPPELTLEEQQALVTTNRAAAYQRESDPLYFKWQRGEATEAEWLAKIEEIKLRYPNVIQPEPLPDEPGEQTSPPGA